MAMGNIDLENTLNKAFRLLLVGRIVPSAWLC